MQFSEENTNENTIRAYSESSVQIGQTVYKNSIIMTTNRIVSWPIQDITKLTIQDIDALLLDTLTPDMIIIGHTKIGQLPDITLYEALSKQQIGLESMSIGAACRTFNVLLGEGRSVMLGIIIP